MNILLLAKAYPPETGGVETYSEQVAQAYARAGHNVIVITAHLGSKSKDVRNGVTVINVGQEGGQIGVFRRMLRRLWTLRRQPFDFVHATTWRVALPAMIVRRTIPMAVTIHGREVFVVPRPLRPLMSRVLTHAQYLPTVSQPIIDKLEADLGRTLPKAFPNWNGISFEKEAFQEKEASKTVNLFCMCRLVERKNVQGAIRAVAELVRRGYQIHFDIAGGGPEANALSELIAELNMEGSVTLLGRVPDEDVPILYHKSHIFLHPQVATLGGQDMEGFGLTIADGMAFGCVPIAGASGGPLDFIQNGKTGYLVDGTQTSAIVDALENMLRNPDHMAALAQGAYEFAHQNLTWDAHAAKILERPKSR